MNTYSNGFKAYFSDYFTDVKKDILAYRSDEDMWKIVPGTSNSGGTLCLHLIGNVNYFFGAAILKNGYVRERAKEFTLRGLIRKKLLEELDIAHNIINSSLDSLSMDDFHGFYPKGFWQKEVDSSVHQIMLKLLSHFSYHAGQINYHMRMMNSFHEE